MTITPLKIQKLDQLIKSAKHIVITAHKSPDGDSVGSSLGLYHYLRKKHTNVNICHPDPAPDFLRWMPGHDMIRNLEEHEAEVKSNFEHADLIFCLDYNSSGRIGQMEKPLLEADAKRIMIDHHRDPDEEFCDLMFSDIEACSTSQLIYEIIQASDDINLMDAEMGTPIYSGIVTDTGSFRFSSTAPKTHVIVANLMNKGINHSVIHEKLFDNNSLDRLKLVSYAMLEKLVVVEECKAAYIALTLDELKKFNARKGDTEGLVNQILGIKGIQMAVFMKEADGIVKMSFRSKGEIPVNNMARNHFGGGGHLNASGGKVVGSVENAIDKLVTILPTFVEENKVHFE